MTSNEGTLAERLRMGTVAEVHRMFLAMHQHFGTVCGWITRHVERTERSLVLFNFLSASANYVHMAAHSLETHVSVLALATRSLYELNLRSRHALESDDNMRLWLAEAAMDQIQLFDGMLRLARTGDAAEQCAILRSEIDRLKELVNKHKLPILERVPSTASIAESVGQTEEHRALFKLFSKLVHPSSYLVNSYSFAESQEVRVILQVHAQLYALDTLSRICDALSVPEDRRSFSCNNT